MTLSEIRSVVKKLLFEDTIHRSDAFINKAINEGHQLIALFALFDERRTTLNIPGSRNFVAQPTSTTATCFAPLYVANAESGKRLNPVRPDQLEFYATKWEGQIDSTGEQYYTNINPYHHMFNALILCPIDDSGRTNLNIIGAYIPIDLSADTDTPRLTEDFQDLLVIYAHFYGLISEPSRTKAALVIFKQFVERLNELINTIKSRFPSGRDYEPFPLEFAYAGPLTNEKPIPEQKQNEN